ncbi:hypothetical protein A3C34_03150 [Candidatus Amesbacteria bacterium RIFCSPHIGHO2_02_FULL_48_21]|uniref:DNA-directed DNA polymerase n=1 Tax=Candidatus Amesbacteria bacterium GW2011_GWA1_48_9 TaxID=1618355 RepID=A0A0G1XCV4_9BACT|nr:MAG: DNA-directed DNA polymerase [Candidatus Amesbacteria bacterium GW2011_GWA1_48_9]OGC90599.1 MAG: hypothetical protein A2V48_01585 [Candidatus Amesbacteria bacterium RBG_19FT_COMBO_48_16]OGC97345.1 MAG: hypothetical protein A3C34_03150 [Candidatus Amesbacteria bacterium RIFCSPHIGHO2_02_FULL_48_21]OGC98676.1 MAG: hypothetical protein A2702_01970 [Candidatus Amesbacteria bacterium RIFCSPHIGHO2_01_FULL_48_75]OGD06525.1 MAG: hypothetical protein A3B58_02600 [Candidatus Amesbacteria bacterium 
MTVRLVKLGFNPKPPTVMHLDLNSCFASVEQQADPFLRGRPVAVAAYDSPGGCIIAPSVEAKQAGVKVGMRVRQGRSLCPELTVLPPDPNKYRAVHLALRKLLETYTDKVCPKSIDEFVLDLEGAPAWRRGMVQAAGEIKRRIREEIGEWLRVSVGIGPNRFLAKTAASLRKPDGLETIDESNFRQVYRRLAVTDLCGIKTGNLVRLNGQGIFTAEDFYLADEARLKAAFASVAGYYWYCRLRGWEIDEVVFGRRSYGNSYALPKSLTDPEELLPILLKLVVKMGARVRRAGWRARGVHVSLLYRDWSHWHRGQVQAETVFDDRDIYAAAVKILGACPYRKPVHTLAVSCFDLVKAGSAQMSLFGEAERKERLARAIDEINDRWGQYVITPALMLGTGENVPDRVAFGGVKELEEAVMAAV